MSLPDTNKNSDIRSEEVQEILTKPPAWIVRWGITLIFLFTLIILILSFMIRYPDFVSAQVVVTTKKPPEKVISRVTGQLEKIFIKNGDTIKANEPLAIIENSAIYQDVILLEKILDSARNDLRNFSFPIDSTSRMILGEIEPVYIEFERSYLNFQLIADLKPYENQINGEISSLKEMKSRLQNHIDQRNILERELELRKKELNRYELLYNKGVISEQEYETRQIDYLNMQKNLNNLAISISQMKGSMISSNQTLKNTEIEKSENQTRYLKNLIQSLNSLQRAVKDWKYKYILSSSIDGVVSFQNFWGANQQVNQGDLVFSILPKQHKEFIGKLLVPSQNTGKISVGQKVLLKLNNFSYQQYGMVIGRVKSISLSPNDNGNYILYISLPNGLRTSYNKRLEFNQELLGTAEIITEDLSVADRIFYKVRNILK